MNLSILGAGNVGMALARAFIRAGQPVTLGVPDPARHVAAVAARPVMRSAPGFHVVMRPSGSSWKIA